MHQRSVILLLLGLFVLGFIACQKDAPFPPEGPVGDGPGTPVDLDWEAVPYPTLSQYGFFEGSLANLQPVEGVLPYAPITPEFGDHAKKIRFVWMPPGAKASYVSDDQTLDFPEGTILIKTNYYQRALPSMGRRLLDSRMLIRRNGSWTFAQYVWNEEQTDAVLDLAGTDLPITWVDDDGQAHDEVFRIPSDAECLACHMNHQEIIPIGPKPQNLNTDFPYADGTWNQLSKWEALGHLASGYPTSIETVARWDDPDETLEHRVRAYLDMNCAHCHSDGGFCSYRPMRFAWHESEDPTNLGVCVPPEDQFDPTLTYIVTAGSAERSMLYRRISSTDENVRMPLLGRTVRHEQAIQLVEDWIDSMPTPCP